MWKHGTLEIPRPDSDGYTLIRYAAKVYGAGSEFGIEGGRISKMELRQNGRRVYHYDRGEDMEPQTPEAEIALEHLLEKYA